MMILDACVACDLRSNPIDFGVKVKIKLGKFEFVVAGGIYVPFRTGFI